MTQRIKITSKALPRLEVTSETLPSIDKTEVASALGTVKDEVKLNAKGSPPSVFALRQEMAARLISSGGRPSLEGTTRRQKIPMAESDWVQLCELAALLEDEELRPTPGQVASVLLHHALLHLDLPKTRSDLKEKIRSNLL